MKNLNRVGNVKRSGSGGEEGKDAAEENADHDSDDDSKSDR